MRTVYIQHQYYVNFTENGQQQPVYINLIRDPVERLISRYYFDRVVISRFRRPENLTEKVGKISVFTKYVPVLISGNGNNVSAY